MSTTSGSVRLETYPSARGQRTWAAVAVMLGTAFALAGLVDLPASSSTTTACVARVGCEQTDGSGAVTVGSIESSFAIAGAQGASAIWLESAIGPPSPSLMHFLHPGDGASSAFEPVAPALEHFRHPLASPAFEPVSPALEHFLHPST